METITIENSNFFSNLILDYINQDENLSEFYNLFACKENYFKQAETKLSNYKNREVLVNQIRKQLKSLDLSKKQRKNLKKLAEQNTVTITTGHQLNLFTGPVFFFYKILQVIKTCKELNKKQSDINFVPLFWMATEDHDFEEINHFNFKDRIIHWNKLAGGPVGRLTTEGLKDVFENFLALVPNGNKKLQLQKLIEESYLNSDTLAKATRKLVHFLFKDYGLLFIDGDDKELKKLMFTSFKEELLSSKSHKHIKTQNDKLEKFKYPIQVNPREINLFYMNDDNSRERILKKDNIYSINNTSISFSEDEIISDLEQNPEKYSPNAVLRPLYQETILPNVAYIGGGGEITYWLQLKEMFNQFQVDFPLLVLRNSILIRTEKQRKKQEKLHLSNEDLFSNSLQIAKRKAINTSEIVPELPKLEDDLKIIFKKLEELSISTDSSFLDMIQAQRTKQLKGFEKIKKRLIHAEVKQNKDFMDRIEQLFIELTQQNSLQERVRNFADFDYTDVSCFVDFIYNTISPFSFDIIINTLSENLKQT